MNGLNSFNKTRSGIFTNCCWWPD